MFQRPEDDHLMVETCSDTCMLCNNKETVSIISSNFLICTTQWDVCDKNYDYQWRLPITVVSACFSAGHAYSHCQGNSMFYVNLWRNSSAQNQNLLLQLKSYSNHSPPPKKKLTEMPLLYFRKRDSVVIGTY